MTSTPRRLDALLINPGGRTQIYQSLGPKLTAVESPIWTGLLATFLRRRGLAIDVLDANAEELTPEQTAQRIVDANPLLAVVVAYGHNPSATTQIMPFAGAVCQSLKQLSPQLKVILVGGHVAALPERTLHEEAADFVCDGEGPYTLSDLLQALKANEQDLSKVRGLWYREDGQFRSTAPAPLVVDLDGEMPGMAWDLLPMKKYRAHNWHCFGHLDRRQPYASLYTTLGCPYHCGFCCIQAPFRTGERALGYKENRNSYRYWSPESVIAQLDVLVREYGVYNVKIADEIFIYNVKHVLGICDLINQRGYDLNIWAYARVDTLSDRVMARLRDAGIRWLCFGFEAGSPRVRNDVHKGFGQEKVFEAMDKVRKAGVWVIGNYMVGLPEDDHETMQATLDMATELNCEFFNLYCAMAYPGSQLYETAIREKWPLPASWAGYSQHAADTLPLPTRYISGEEVLQFRDRAFRTYFTNPKYLTMIGQKFGPETVEHIHEMLGHQLQRTHVPAAAQG
jgi:anaerobic magnesium-protoporphyrin IX monomethyl ester cyclase